MAQDFKAEELTRNKWWNADEYKAHDRLFALVKYIDTLQRHYHQQDWIHWRLFDNDAALKSVGRVVPRRNDDDLRLTLNVVRACVTTIHSKVTQTKPRPTYLTIGQGQRARQKAKNTQAYSDALLYHTDGYTVASDAMLTALTLGTGAVKTSRPRGAKPRAESVPLHEIKVEHADGRKGNPRCIYHHYRMERDELLESHEGDAKAIALIKAAKSAPREHALYENELADMVMVIEAYRRPLMCGGKGGRHVVALENGTLKDEKWYRDIPIRFIRWGKRPAGWRGYGIAEQLKELQVEINWTLMTASEQMRLSGPKIAVERGSSINEDELNNEIWGIIEYTGTEPKFMMFQSVDPALFQHVDRCYARSFDEVGVSQMSAQGEKPSGLNSAKALMTFSDLETAKFSNFGSEYENLMKVMSQDLLDAALDDEDEDEESQTKVLIAPIKDKYRRRYLQKIKKSDVASSRDEFICQVFPTSQLAQQPAQKMQQVGDMQDRGWLQPIEAMQLLDFPDLENATSLATSPLEYVDMCIDRMLEDGEALRPEPWIDLKMARERVTHALMRAQIEEVPEKRWQLLAGYANACSKGIAAATPPAPPPGAPPGAPAPGAAPPPQAMAA